MIVLHNGLVMTPDGPESTDVVIRDGRVESVGATSAAAGHETVDCSGMWVGPGFVDLHVHLREPGQEWKEDIASGSRAAAAGGFTAVLAMPNTDPATDSGHLARYISDRGRQVGLTDVVPVGALTMDRAGGHLAHLDDLWAAGVRMFSDDGDSVEDAGMLRRAMEYLAERGGVIAQHAEDRGLARGGHMHEGSVSSRLGMAGLPALAEESIVARDLGLVRLTGVAYHVQHASTAGTVQLVREAKAAGLPVTSEATPHHLSFTHELVESMDPVAKMYPPLRTKNDVGALAEAVRDGTIDAIATDHAPHASSEKEVPFEDAPRGVIGLETSASAVNTALGLDPRAFFDRMSVGPAAIAQLADHGLWVEPGVPANLVVFDPEAAWTVTMFESKSSNSPWLGRTLTGCVTATFLRGEPTHRREGVHA